jgi:hypothetical protein
MNDMKFHVATADEYSATADELVKRIFALIPTHPEILTMEDAWPLLRISEFKYADLQPSAFQATWALGKACQLWQEQGASHE